jgi:hypothetical protein
MSQETLLSQTTIWLFGRPLVDLTINKTAYKNIPRDETTGEKRNTPPRRSQNEFLFAQLNAELATLARIYGFSYEAFYYDLARPTIFLVHGPGIDPEGLPNPLAPNQAVLSRMPSDTGRTGVAAMMGSFTGEIKAWAYDRADFTIRLDMEGGSFDTLLLAAELGETDLTSRAGSVARSAGSVARAAGSVARAAGSVARARRGSSGNSE